jgi:hypothetical protein
MQISQIQENKKSQIMLFDRVNNADPHKIDEKIRDHVIKTVKAEKKKVELTEVDSPAKCHSEYKT